MVELFDSDRNKFDSYCIKHDHYFRLGYTCILCVNHIQVSYFQRLIRWIGRKFFGYGNLVRPSRRFGEFKQPKEQKQ